jgi:hypothetical protein
MPGELSRERAIAADLHSERILYQLAHLGGLISTAFMR